MKILKRIKFHYEIKELLLKLEFLYMEYESGCATEVDAKYWEEFLQKLTKFQDENVTTSKEDILIYKYRETYERYIPKKKEIIESKGEL